VRAWLTTLVLATAGCAAPIEGGLCEGVADAGAPVVTSAGVGPIVLTSPHSGGAQPRDLETCAPLQARTCAGLEAEDACASGPCRVSGGDAFVDEIVVALGTRLAERSLEEPAVVRGRASREYVDFNRDADDPRGGARCALGEPRAGALWRAFHDDVEAAVDAAVAAHGARALLVDVHTYQSLPEVPERLVMIGTGQPVGLTVPRLAQADPSLGPIFADGGMRDAIASALVDTQVLPAAPGDDVEALFNGRHVVRHYSARVDALQLEVSDPVRQEPARVADALALGIEAYLAAR
jgi:hypothetical protein